MAIMRHITTSRARVRNVVRVLALSLAAGLFLYGCGGGGGGAVTGTPATPLQRRTRLIGWSASMPTASELRTKLTQMQTSPFDGVVLIARTTDAGREIDLTWQGWGPQAFTQAQFASTVADLKAIHSQSLTDNLLRLNVSPGRIDWFDDAGWSSILSNAALASWICGEGGLKGVMLDTEQYANEGSPFDYSVQPNQGSHSFADYCAQAHMRGEAYAAALTATKSDLNILITYANSYLVLNEKAPLPYSKMGLLPAFLDGMIAGTAPGAHLIDALEIAYGAKDRQTLTALKSAVTAGSALSANPALYSSRIQTGFGVWADKDWETTGWDPDNCTKNYYQPTQLEADTAAALSLSDRYVWVYSQKADWLRGINTSAKYTLALQRAKHEAY